MADKLADTESGAIVFTSLTGRQMSVTVAPKTIVEEFPIAAVP